MENFCGGNFSSNVVWNISFCSAYLSDSVFNNDSNPSRPTVFANSYIGDGSWTSILTIRSSAKTHFSTYAFLNCFLHFHSLPALGTCKLLNGTSSSESESGWEIRTTALIGVGVLGSLKWFSMSKQLVESERSLLESPFSISDPSINLVYESFMRFSISSSPSLLIVSNYAYISSDDMLVIGALLFLFETLVHFNKSSLCSFITQMINTSCKFQYSPLWNYYSYHKSIVFRDFLSCSAWFYYLSYDSQLFTWELAPNSLDVLCII